MTTMSRIENTLDGLNVYHRIGKNYGLIEFWTDLAGQDIPTEIAYDGSPEDFVKQFAEAADNYDVDEEVELYASFRGQRGVPGTIREILDDCTEAKETLMQIANELKLALCY